MYNIMKQLTQIISIFLFVFFASSYSFAQKGYYDQELEMPFQPRFTLGSGYYSSQGDIKGPKANSLLGNLGFKAGMRLNIANNTDVSLLFSDFKLSETAENKFSSEVNTIGLHLDYTLNSIFKQTRISPFISCGVDRVSYITTYWENYIGENQSGETSPTAQSSFVLPIGLGLALNVSERIRLDIGFKYITSFADFDMEIPSNTDNILLADFSIHYDFFTLNPAKNIIDDSYYSDVNFKALDVEDEDGDLVPDIDDACPNTPQGVDVDAKGCPLDGDNDGIPNYLDKELNTMEGSLVDENGVKLTEDKYQSMYGYEVALRTYADVYNLEEVNKGDYQTINEYLIAKANTFNKAFNEGENLDKIVEGLRYKVQIAKYNEEIPEDIQVRLLSINDLESIAQDDGYVLYIAGSYSSIEDALIRSDVLESQGFDDIYFLVDNNGSISEYKPPSPPKILEESEIDTSAVVPEEVVESPVVVVVDTAVTYRVQIGAYEVVLSKEIFNGISNVIHMKDKDGFIKYMTGSFSDKKEAIDYMFQMRARGFEDAFVVAYQNGQRTIEYFAPLKNKNTSNSTQSSVNIEANQNDKIELINIQFTVQILVANTSLDSENLKKMAELGNIEKEAQGTDMFRYFIGTYASLAEAKVRLLEAQELGYKDAFIFAKLDGERITLEQAKELLQE